MSKRYYIEYPRDFANEYTIYVTNGNDEAFRAAYPNAERITRARAIERGIRRPRLAAQCSEQWYGGFAVTANSEYQRDRDMRDDAATDSDLIHYAAVATADLLADLEA